MTCSLESYRTRIGTYNGSQKTWRRKFCSEVSHYGYNLGKCNLLVRVITATYIMAVLSSPLLIEPSKLNSTWQTSSSCSTLTDLPQLSYVYLPHQVTRLSVFNIPLPVSSSPIMQTPVSSSPIRQTPVSSRTIMQTPVSSSPIMQTPVSSSPIIQWPVHPQTNQSTQFGIWDPGDAEAHPYKWVYSLNWNIIAHITYGNRGQRGKGITCVYWNKGPSFLCNRLVDIEYKLSWECHTRVYKLKIDLDCVTISSRKCSGWNTKHFFEFLLQTSICMKKTEGFQRKSRFECTLPLRIKYSGTADKTRSRSKT